MENQIEIINQRDVELLDKNRKINLQKLFTEDGINEIISAIESEIKDFKSDVLTKEGRAEIVSLAFKIAKCKAPIKNLASELKEDSRKLIDSVNLQLNRYESAIDKLRDKIRKPVDEIEEKIEKHKQESLVKIDKMQKLAFFGLTSNDIQQAIIEVRQIFDNFDFGEFTCKAENDKITAINHLRERLDIALKAEADALELKKLREEKEEREKKDREEQIAREAVEKAIKEAEQREQKIHQEKIDAENRAKEQAEIAEKNRILAEKKAKEEAEKAVAEAIERERNRVDAEKRKEAEALEKREANKKHRAKINNEALDKIIKIISEFEGSPVDASKAIIEAIARGEVPHVQINY